VNKICFSTTTDYPLYQRPWLDTNNSLDMRLDNSRSLPHTESNKRSFLNVSEPPPLAPPTTSGSWSFWWRGGNRTEAAAPPHPPSNSSGGGGTLVTVQMLPKRLASILQQAEQYARSTLSSVTSTLIGGKEAAAEPLLGADGPVRRRAKYFPPLSSLFGYEAKDGRPPRPLEVMASFSPVQIIKNPEWRLSRYIPLRRFTGAARRVGGEPSATPAPAPPHLPPQVPGEEVEKPEANTSVANRIEPLVSGPR